MQRARKFSAVFGTTSARSCRNKVQREGRDDFDLETPPQPAYGRQPNSGGLSAMVNFAQPAHSLTAPCSVALQVKVASPADFCSARVEELQHCVCRAPTEVTPPRRHDQRCSRVRSATAAPAQQKHSLHLHLFYPPSAARTGKLRLPHKPPNPARNAAVLVWAVFNAWMLGTPITSCCYKHKMAGRLALMLAIF